MRPGLTQFLATSIALVAAGCQPSNPSERPTQLPPAQLAELPAFPPPPPPRPELPDQSGGPGEAAAPLTLPRLSWKSFRKGAADGEPPVLSLYFEGDARVILGAKPQVSLEPALRTEVKWEGPRQLLLRFLEHPSPATGISFVIKGSDGADQPALTDVAEWEPLHIWSPDYRSWNTDTPQGIERDAYIRLHVNRPIEPSTLRPHIAVQAADAKHPDTLQPSQLPPFSPVDWELMVRDPNGLALAPAGPAKDFLVRPTERFRSGRIYRIEMLAGLRGEGGLLVKELPRFVVHGPLPFTAKSAECGWGRCLPDSVLHVHFTRPSSDPVSSDCISIDPPVDIESMQVQGTSLEIQPKSLKAFQKYRLTVGDACRSFENEKLKRPVTFEFQVEMHDPRVALAGTSGVVAVPADGGVAQVPVKAFATRHIEVRDYAVGNDDASRLAALGLDLAPWSELDTSTLPFSAARKISTPDALTRPRPYELPLESLAGGKPGWAVAAFEPVGLRKDPNNKPTVHHVLVQATALAMTAKTGPSGTTVRVSQLADGAPVADAEVALFGADGRELWRGRTEADGTVASQVGRRAYDQDGAPDRLAFVLAARGDDHVGLNINGGETRVDTWRFDLPTDWEDVRERTVGLVFTERGIYRPGDTVHIKALLRSDRGAGHASLAGHPVRVTIDNPLGQQATMREVNLGTFGDASFSFPTGADATTGTWHIRVEPLAEAGGRPTPGTTQLHGSFRIEAFRPPSFQATVDDVSISNGRVKARLGGRYYFGAPMAAGKGGWHLSKRPADFTTPAHPDYVFGLPAELDDWENRNTDNSRQVLDGEVVLDAEGRFELDAALPADPVAVTDGEPAATPTPLSRNVPGRPWVYQVELTLTDADAQVASARAEQWVHPAAFYTGIRLATAFTNAGQAVAADIIAVDPDGKLQAGKDLAVELIHRRWEERKVPDVAGEMVSNWVEVEDIVARDMVRTRAEGPVTWSATPRDGGFHVVRISGTDTDGRKVASLAPMWVSGHGAGWAQEADDSVKLVSEKARHAVGDVARFVVQSPFRKAQAWVTVETSQVISRQQFVLEGDAPFIEVPVTASMAPNAYVSVTLYGQREGDEGPARARFGYMQLKVDTADRRLQVKVNPDVARRLPGERVSATITVTDAAGKPVGGQVTFMAVDESVLALTGYRTPDVHPAVFRDRPHGMTTLETRKLVLAHRAIYDEDTKSEWGGGGETGLASRYRSEFATTAAFLPEVSVGADGRAEVAFDLPDNLGAFRLMAVAASEDGRYGSGESQVEVQKPLIVRPGLPRFATSGDLVDIQGIVQALSPQAQGRIEVKAVVTGPATLVGPDQGIIEVAGGAATPMKFQLKALSAGAATVAFAARNLDTGISDAVEISLPIAHPAATRHAVTTGQVPGPTGDATSTAWRVELPADSDPTQGGLEIDIQNSQLGVLLPALEYVMQYPYGCAEQTTSGTLPLIALARMKAATTALRIEEDAVLKRIQAGVDRLLSMQTMLGGLGYWPGDSDPHPWASAWAALALVEASELPGIRLAPTRLENLLVWLREVTRDRAPVKPEWRHEMTVIRPFAAWVLARAGQAEPANQTALFEARAGMPVFAKAMLALAIDASKRPEGRTQIDTLLTEMRASVKVEGQGATVREQDGGAWRFTMSSDIRSTALLAMLMGRTHPNDPLVTQLHQGLLDSQRGGRWYNTQENAFALLALGERISADLSHDGTWQAAVHLGDEVLAETTMDGRKLGSARVVVPMDRLAAANGKALAVVRKGAPGNLYYTLHLRHVPVTPPTEAADHGFVVERAWRRKGDPEDAPAPTSFRLGDVIEVAVTVQTPRDAAYVAVEDPLPAGFEPVLLMPDKVAEPSYDIENGGDDGLSNSFNHADQRDDRVYLFADRLQAGRHVHRYLVRATTSGRFTAPAAMAHEMYAPWVEGHSAPGTVEVKVGSGS